MANTGADLFVSPINLTMLNPHVRALGWLVVVRLVWWIMRLFYMN